MVLPVGGLRAAIQVYLSLDDVILTVLFEDGMAFEYSLIIGK